MPKKTYEQFKEEILNVVKEYEDLKQRYAAGSNINLSPAEVRQYFEDAYRIRNGFSNIIDKAASHIPYDKKYEYFYNVTPDSEKNYLNKCIINTMKLSRGDQGRIIDLISDDQLKADVSKDYDEIKRPYADRRFLNSNRLERLQKEKKVAGADVAKIDAEIAKLEAENEELYAHIRVIDAQEEDFSKLGPQGIADLDTLPEDKQKEAKDFIYNSLAQVVQNNLSKSENLYEAYKAYLESIEKEGINLDDCVPEDYEYELPYNYDEHHKEKRAEAEIKALDAKATDAEFKAILNDINENILVVGSDNSVNLTAAIAEPQGKACGRDIRDAVFEVLEKDVFYTNNITKTGNTVIAYNLKPRNEGESEYLYEDVFSGEMRFDQNLKDSILEITKAMDQVCTYHGDKETAEQGTKIYGFEGLATRRNALTEAVQSGNEETIRAAYADYKNAEKIYDRMLEVADAIDNGSVTLPDNVSCARTAFMPAKIRNDIVGSSRINGIWELWALSKKTGISVEKFLDSPSESYKAAAESLADENCATQKYFKTASTADIIAGSAQMATMTQVSAPDVAAQGFINRSLEALVTMSGENRLNNSLFHAKFQAVVHGPMQEHVCAIPSAIFMMDKASVFERLIVCEKEDISMYNISEAATSFKDVQTGKAYETIDCAKYMKEGKVTSERVTYKLCETIKEMQSKHPDFADDKDFKKAISNTIKTVLKEDILKTKETTRLLTEINNKIAANKPINLDKMSAYRNFNIVNGVENVMQNISISNNSSQSFIDSLKTMKSYKDQYDHSNIFMKWFSSDTKKLLTMSEEIEQKLMDKGVSVSDIELAKDLLEKNDSAGLDNLCKEFETNFNGSSSYSQKETREQVDLDELAVELDDEFSNGLNETIELEKGETLLDEDEMQEEQEHQL